MPSSHFNSVMARCLTDPSYLQRLHTASRSSDITENVGEHADTTSRLDLNKISRLAGFITKVQNNHTYSAIPLTRKLLRRLQLDNQVFEAYHGLHHWCKNRSKLNRLAKTSVFLRFLSKYLTQLSGDDSKALQALLQHEKARWQVFAYLQTKQPRVPFRADEENGPPRPQNRIGVCGHLRVHVFAVDPILLSKQLVLNNDVLTTSSSAFIRYAYWGNPVTRTLSIFRVNDTAARILALAKCNSPLENLANADALGIDLLQSRDNLSAVLNAAFPQGLLVAH